MTVFLAVPRRQLDHPLALALRGRVVKLDQLLRPPAEPRLHRLAESRPEARGVQRLVEVVADERPQQVGRPAVRVEHPAPAPVARQQRRQGLAADVHLARQVQVELHARVIGREVGVGIDANEQLAVNPALLRDAESDGPGRRPPLVAAAPLFTAEFPVVLVALLEQVAELVEADVRAVDVDRRREVDQ